MKNKIVLIILSIAAGLYSLSAEACSGRTITRLTSNISSYTCASRANAIMRAFNLDVVSGGGSQGVAGRSKDNKTSVTILCVYEQGIGAITVNVNSQNLDAESLANEIHNLMIYG